LRNTAKNRIFRYVLKILSIFAPQIKADMIALIIIYNHRYDKNIETVERIYKGRFSHIFHLMPFYDGDKPNVFPVYDNSYCFQAFVAQTFPSIFNKKFSHYFFVSDDMITILKSTRPTLLRSSI
jgi:hypothetical protein